MAYNHGVYQFGLFDGDTSSTAIRARAAEPLRASARAMTVERYLRWVHAEMQGSRHVRVDAGLCGREMLIPLFATWCGVTLRILLGEERGRPLGQD